MVVPLDAARTGDGALTDELTWIWRLLAYAPGGGGQRMGLLRLAAAGADRQTRLKVLSELAELAYRTGDHDASAALHSEALSIARESRDARATASAVAGLGSIALQQGIVHLAGSLYAESLSLWRSLGDNERVSRELAILGWLAACERAHDRAERAFAESLTLRCESDDLASMSLGLLHQGWHAQLRGDRATAGSKLTDALTVAWQDGDPWRLAAVLAALGQPGPEATPFERAARLLAGAEALGWTLVAAGAPSVAAHDRLSVQALATTWTDGRGTTIAALVEYALRRAGGGGPIRRPSRDEVWGEQHLSARELEIAELIGRGYTNRQIAETAVIAERTAETHARNIREKLGFATRTQVAAWAAAALPCRQSVAASHVSWLDGQQLSRGGRATMLPAGSAVFFAGARGTLASVRSGIARRDTA